MVEPEDGVIEIDGIGPKTASDLKDIGRDTVKKLASANPDVLPEQSSLGEKKAADAVSAARESLRDGKRFKDGLDIEKEQKEMGTISTGSENFDSLLRGGVGVEYLTEAYGESSSGKTQLAHQLCVNNQTEESPDNGDQVMFIDVEETFRADRIREMSEAQGLDADETLSNISVSRTKDLSDQENAVKQLKQFELDEVGLIVVDSMVGHIRAEFEGRSEYGERSNRLGSMLSELQKIASNHEVAVFYTNQAGKDPGVQYGDPVYAYGGATMKHRSSFRIRLDSRGSKGYNAALIDSPNLPERDVYFDIFTEGIRNPDFETEYGEDN